MSNLERSPLVAFVHPDLGIGGAERLVVDAAVGLQSRGYNVVIYTSHHDPAHCFEETRDGTLQVRVYGNTVIPRTIFGKFYILCAILRQLHLSLLLLFWDQDEYDVLFVDQLSASVPLLRWFSGAKILFYCHFPDKLLTQRNSLLKRLYRAPIDLFEELTTGAADTIVVNSKFTASIFRQSFRSIREEPQVLYPAINLASYDKTVNEEEPSVRILKTTRKTIISINRFERKKNITLAVHAFAKLRQEGLVPEEMFDTQLRLVIAGGYDSRVTENVEYHQELDLLARKYGLRTHTILPSSLEPPPVDAQVVFLCSFNDTQRTHLLAHALVLLYTPANEHFGIVPVEAMYAAVPVIAVNSGGPTESIVHNVTGLLCEPDEGAWAAAVASFVTGEVDGKVMGIAGREHARKMFSLGAFADQLEGILRELNMKERVVTDRNWLSGLMVLGLLLLVPLIVFLLT